MTAGKTTRLTKNNISVVSGAGPYVDLREEPFNVVANHSSPTVAAQNTAGINLAIATYSGTGANLVLPDGDVFVEEQAPGGAETGGAEIRWCVKFGTGVSRLTLSGQGMFATTLVQRCVGDGGELNLLNIDGAAYIELANLGFRQDMITKPDPAQQNHLVAVYNNTTGGTTEHIRGHNLFFGKCIGDAIRILAADPSDHVSDARFTNFLMVLNGVVTSNPPNGRTGARSGIAIQRGGVDCEFGNFSIVGAQNSAIDEEPSGGSSVRTHFHDFQIDNTLGNTGIPVSLGGSGGGDIAFDGRVHDGHITGGSLTMLGPTSGYQLDRLTIETVTPVANATSLLLIRSGSGGHADLELNDITIKRAGTSTAGNCLDVINTGNRTTIRNLHVVQGVAGSPVVIDGATHLHLDGYRLHYRAPAPQSRHGALIQAINSDADDIRISDVDIVSSTGRLQAAVHLDQRIPRWPGSRSPTSDRRAPRATGSTCRSTRGEEHRPNPGDLRHRQRKRSGLDPEGSERQPDQHRLPDHLGQPRRHLHAGRAGDTRGSRNRYPGLHLHSPERRHDSAPVQTDDGRQHRMGSDHRAMTRHEPHRQAPTAARTLIHTDRVNIRLCARIAAGGRGRHRPR